VVSAAKLNQFKNFNPTELMSWDAMLWSRRSTLLKPGPCELEWEYWPE
jgi:hypothetical protein